MEEVVSTVYYNGQFWVVLVEKIGGDGSLKVGKYTFGPEPTNAELIHFYQNIYPYLPLYETDEKIRFKKRRSVEEQGRCTKKSLDIYNACRSEIRDERKKQKKQRDRLQQEELYKIKCLKRKDKKRGH